MEIYLVNTVKNYDLNRCLMINYTKWANFSQTSQNKL